MPQILGRCSRPPECNFLLIYSYPSFIFVVPAFFFLSHLAILISHSFRFDLLSAWDQRSLHLHLHSSKPYYPFLFRRIQNPRSIPKDGINKNPPATHTRVCLPGGIPWLCQRGLRRWQNVNSSPSITLAPQLTKGSCQGFDPWYHPNPSCVFSDTRGDNGFLLAKSYRSRDIICSKGAQAGHLTLTVQAGHSIDVQWTKWPESHHGYMIDSLAQCDGDCQKADLSALKFNKIAQQGRISKFAQGKPVTKKKTEVSGYFITDKFIDDGSLWKFTVPDYVAPGNYVYRNEIIALQMAMPGSPGAQHIPECVNIIVTGSGTDSLSSSGSSPTTWYNADDPGLRIDINSLPDSCPIPGPALYKPGQADALQSYGPVIPPTTTMEYKTSTSGYPKIAPTGYQMATSSGYPMVPPPGYQKLTPSDDQDITPPEKETTESKATQTPTSQDQTSENTPNSDAAVPKQKSNTSPSPDDFSVPDSATASQLLAIIEKCVTSLKQKLSSFSKVRRHARDVVKA